MLVWRDRTVSEPTPPAQTTSDALPTLLVWDAVYQQPTLMAWYPGVQAWEAWGGPGGQVAFQYWVPITPPPGEEWPDD